MSDTWYRIKSYAINIVPVKVIKVTAKQIVYIEPPSWDGGKECEVRSAINTQYDHYFPTFAEAKTSLVDRLKTKIATAQQTIKQHEQDLIKVQALQETL